MMTSREECTKVERHKTSRILSRCCRVDRPSSSLANKTTEASIRDEGSTWMNLAGGQFFKMIKTPRKEAQDLPLCSRECIEYQ